MAIPNDDQEHLLEAVAFMDANECKTVIGAARGSSGKSSVEICEALDIASAEFQKNLKDFKNQTGDMIPLSNLSSCSVKVDKSLQKKAVA